MTEPTSLEMLSTPICVSVRLALIRHRRTRRKPCQILHQVLGSEISRQVSNAVAESASCRKPTASFAILIGISNTKPTAWSSLSVATGMRGQVVTPVWSPHQILRLGLPCLFDPPGRFPFHQMGHPRLPRYLWPLEQVFQPPRFSFGIVSLRDDDSVFATWRYQALLRFAHQTLL